MNANYIRMLVRGFLVGLPEQLCKLIDRHFRDFGDIFRRLLSAYPDANFEIGAIVPSLHEHTRHMTDWRTDTKTKFDMYNVRIRKSRLAPIILLMH
jgi:hypothetical protein